MLILSSFHSAILSAPNYSFCHHGIRVMVQIKGVQKNPVFKIRPELFSADYLNPIINPICQKRVPRPGTRFIWVGFGYQIF